MSGVAKQAAKNEIQVISDDEITASGTDDEPAIPTGKSLGKRKLDTEFEEKVQWSDDSGDGLQRLKKRGKRSSTIAKAQKKKGGKGGSLKREPTTNNDLDVAKPERDDYEVAGAPDYLRDRRRDFDQNRQVLKEAGLLLPPGYADIDLLDGGRLADLAERPIFEESTGVKPCRPYKDVELEYSAGIVPASIAQYLRDYQIVGVKFLHRLFVYQRGGILGDDMGLGKTVQVAAFLTAAFGKTGDERDAKRMRHMRQEGGRWYPRILIICPGSLIQNWKNELQRWGWWAVDLFHGPGKEDVLQTAKAGRIEIMITTYTTYKNHFSLINTVSWDAVIADECHALKAKSAEVTKAMNQVNALCRIGLTGTAIQNKYEELWTLLNWTNPGHFGTLGEWNRSITTPLKVGQSHDATLFQLRDARVTARKLVANLLPGFFLRRLKTMIAHQLPKKSDRVVFCPLTDEQREGYKNFIRRPDVELLRTLSEPCECGSETGKGWCCHKLLPSGQSWQEIIFPCVMTLQKLANHVTLLIPSTSDPPDKQKRELKTLQTCFPDMWEYLYENRDSIMNLANPEFCGKWKVLKKLLKFWHENGDKVLVFSHSVKLLRIFQHLFHNTSYTVAYLDGSLNYEDRQKAVDDFNSDPNQFVFLISTKAGGVGLNITSANKVVIVDPHWNPSYDLQAQDRAYRIGQRRDVDVFRLVSAGTIEEIVYARQIYKQQQANIGYTASNERRYFKGVQEDTDRKGEIFGLQNLFTFREDQLVLRDIVNKTNIAEAKAGAGITVAGVDMEKVAKDEELNIVKKEEPASADAEDGGMSQLAALLTAKNQGEFLDKKKTQQPKSDAIQAILLSAGVEYTHENSEVVGTSKIEEQLSRRAEMVADSDVNPEGNSALFAESQPKDIEDATGLAHVYNPPEDVMKRQFCSMAKEFGFPDATQFALVVESWSQEQRRNCLETFYKMRESRLLAVEDINVKKLDEIGVKEEDAKMGDDTNDDLDVKDEPMSVDESNEEDLAPKTKMREEAKVKIEMPLQKKSSIFLYDTDDEDEL